MYSMKAVPAGPVLDGAIVAARCNILAYGSIQDIPVTSPTEFAMFQQVRFARYGELYHGKSGKQGLGPDKPHGRECIQSCRAGNVA